MPRDLASCRQDPHPWDVSGTIPTFTTISGTITITPSGIPVKVTTKLSLFADSSTFSTIHQ